MKNIKNIIILILLLVIVYLVSYILIYDKQDNNDIKRPNGCYETADNNYSIEKNDDVSDCSFTRTFRMISKIDYPLAADGVSFIVVDEYQGYRPFIVAIPASYNNLEYLKYYEFTYHIIGKGNIASFYDLNSLLVASIANKYLGHYSSDSIDVDLTIEETSKVGFNQINEMICK